MPCMLFLNGYVKNVRHCFVTRRQSSRSRLHPCFLPCCAAFALWNKRTHPAGMGEQPCPAAACGRIQETVLGQCQSEILYDFMGGTNYYPCMWFQTPVRRLPLQSDDTQ